MFPSASASRRCEERHRNVGLSQQQQQQHQPHCHEPSQRPLAASPRRRRRRRWCVRGRDLAIMPGQGSPPPHLHHLSAILGSDEERRRRRHSSCNISMWWRHQPHRMGEWRSSVSRVETAGKTTNATETTHKAMKSRLSDCGSLRCCGCVCILYNRKSQHHNITFTTATPTDPPMYIYYGQNVM